MGTTAIVSIKWLLARMYEPDLVILDCRFVLGKPDSGRSAYEAAHIPGAVYVDLERELSAPIETPWRTPSVAGSGAAGRRHPAGGHRPR